MDHSLGFTLGFCLESPLGLALTNMFCSSLLPNPTPTQTSASPQCVLVMVRLDTRRAEEVPGLPGGNAGAMRPLVAHTGKCCCPAQGRSGLALVVGLRVRKNSAWHGPPWAPTPALHPQLPPRSSENAEAGSSA